MNFVCTTHETWFEGKRYGPKYAHWCEVAKFQAGIQNVLRLLDVGYKIPLDKNKHFLQSDVEKFGSKEALHYFARNIPKGIRFLK